MSHVIRRCPDVDGTEKELRTVETQTPAGTTSGAQSDRSIGELIARVSEQASSLVRDEIEFTLINLKAKVTKLGIGGVLIAAALFLAIFVFNLLLFAAVAAFSHIVAWWAAFLIVAGILLLIVLVLAGAGALALKASKKHVVDPKGAITSDIDAIKKGLDR